MAARLAGVVFLPATLILAEVGSYPGLPPTFLFFTLQASGGSSGLYGEDSLGDSATLSRC
jgi:hypothetical protein